MNFQIYNYIAIGERIEIGGSNNMIEIECTLVCFVINIISINLQGLKLWTNVDRNAIGLRTYNWYACLNLEI